MTKQGTYYRIFFAMLLFTLFKTPPETCVEQHRRFGRLYTALAWAVVSMWRPWCLARGVWERVRHAVGVK